MQNTFKDLTPERAETSMPDHPDSPIYSRDSPQSWNESLNSTVSSIASSIASSITSTITSSQNSVNSYRSSSQDSNQPFREHGELTSYQLPRIFDEENTESDTSSEIERFWERNRGQNNFLVIQEVERIHYFNRNYLLNGLELLIILIDYILAFIIIFQLIRFIFSRDF